MYRVLCDGIPIHDLRDEELVVIDPQVTLEVNTAGSFSFKIPPKHPQYDLPKKMKSLIEVWHDDVQIFAGRPTGDKLDFYNRKNIDCEGQLAYLNDTIQRPAEYHNMTVRGYLETLIEIHNSQVDESKQFEVGIVTVTDTNDSLYRYTNYNSTWQEIKEDLIDDLGGYIRVRNHNGHRYIDYIAGFDDLCSQSIQFGENLLDCVRETDMTEIATAVIPLGAKLEESEIAALEERLTIKSVNNDLDYIAIDEAVKKYGFIVKTVIWDNVTTPQMLLSKGRKWLTDEQFENMVIDVKAVDLHMTDEQIEQFKLFDMVHVHSTPHGLDRRFPVTKMTVYLDRPSSNTYTLGTEIKTSLTSMISDMQSEYQKVVESIPIPSVIVQQAVDQATALITAATRGYVVTTANEQLIMDTKDVNTAQRVWRWNLNGLGYSSTGYNGTYASAITMDGWIVGQRIAANSISGEKLDITYKASVTKEIADAEETARQDAENYTDDQLKNYYTKSQIETSIRTLEDSVLLSAKETAEQYVDGKLKNYYTTSQVNVLTDAISLQVINEINNRENAITKLQSQITQNAKEIELKVSSDQVSSIIKQNADSIRLKASKISWSSSYSSMSEDGHLTCEDATITGKFETIQPYGSSYKKTTLTEGVLYGYFGSELTGLLDLSANYADSKRHAALKGYDYLHIQAGTLINIENEVKFYDKVTFSTAPTFNTRLSFNNGVTFNADVTVSSGATFEERVTFNTSSYCRFYGDTAFWEPVKMYNLSHVSSGGYIVFASDGQTLAYLSSSSKRYKDHVENMTVEDAKSILNIPVVWFKYKKEYLDSDDWLYDKKLPGLYAEDVFKYMPEATQMNADGKPEDWNFRVLIPAMLKLIQNLYHGR